MNSKKKIIISALCVAVIAVAATVISLAAASKGTITGTVTESGTNSPVAGVSVTDGRNVVKTDDNGKYEIKVWRKSHFIAVTIPSGYETDNYYIPFDKATESYDFTLDRSSVTNQDNHSFLQISDTEIGEGGTGEWLDDIKAMVKENEPAFLIHTGDICYEAGLKRHIEDMNTETMGCSVKYVIGNHDYVDGKYGEELYESLYGPVWYSFEVGKVHYVVTSFQTGSDYKSFYNKNDRWKWLKNDLENVDDDMKVVMFNHTKSPSDDYVLSFGREELDLKKHNLAAWVFGHYHYNYVYENEGVLNISAPRPDCGGIDSSPAGTRIISVSADGSISTEMKYYDLGMITKPENTVWSTELDGNVLFCDTVFDNGFVYTATVDDDYPRNCKIYCLDAENGKIKWEYQAENSVKNNICIDNDRLVAMDVSGNVYCLDKANGTVIWQKAVELGNTVGTSSAICINDGVIFAGTARTVTALKLNDGSVKWTNNRDRGENSPAEFVVYGNKLLVNSHWDSLAALDAESGKALWDNKDEDIRFRSSTPVAVDDNTLLVADDDAVMLVDINSGDITNKTSFEEYSFSSSAQPALLDGIAYIPTSNDGLVAFDLNSKKIVWHFETEEAILFTAPYAGKGKKIVESTPVIDGENIVFGANDGCIYTVNAKSGELVNKYQAGSAVLGKLALKDDKIYAGTFDGYAVCYNKK